MKVAHLVLSGDVAGGQLVAVRLAKAADDAVVLVPGRGPLLDVLAAEGVRGRVVDLGRTASPGAARRLAAVLREERPDILHTHGMLATSTHARIAGRLARVPVVAHMHIENYFRPGAAGAAQRVLDNVTARLCAAIVAVSGATRDALVRQGYPRERLEVIPNGIELPVAPPPGRLRAELGIPEGARVVGHVGRLAPVKGQRELIEAVAGLESTWLVLIGEDIEAGGAYRRELEQLAGPGVIFAGYRADARELIGDLDVLALPSHAEGLPLVVLEAMAWAKPVVATAVGGTPELVENGVTGVVVPPGDVAALREALARVTPEMGAAGRVRVEREFSAARMVERVRAVYEHVLGHS